MVRRASIRAGILATLLAAAAPVLHLGAAPGPPPAPSHVLLVTLDTTRADHLSCYGHAVLTTPNIDRLAAEGVRFERASATIPLTGPGHASMLTGLLPREHGAIRNGLRVLDAVPILPEILSVRGWRTAAFVSGWTLRAPLSGLDRGFDLYDDEMTDRYDVVNNQRPGDATVDRALEWLEARASAPFFLWVHLFDPHAPYRKHGFDLGPNPAARPSAGRRSSPPAYDQEIHFADLQVGRLLAALDRLRLRDSTLIILAADHGEAFGEHGEEGHGRHLYEATQHVPLILSHPSLGPGRVSTLPATTLDIAPTILGIMGVPAPPGNRGVALGEALVAPGSFAAREIYQETFPGAQKPFLRWFLPAPSGQPTRVAVRRGDWKAILEPGSGRIEMFDLAVDPGEVENLAGSQTVRLQALRPLLVDHAARPWRSEEGQQRMTEDDRQRLQSLGYLN
jgi:arylsulfatase A-like enzyme